MLGIGQLALRLSTRIRHCSACHNQIQLPLLDGCLGRCGAQFVQRTCRIEFRYRLGWTTGIGSEVGDYVVHLLKSSPDDLTT